MLIIALFFSSCANIVPPSGGPKDVEPPKVIHSTPDNHSINFTGNSIRLYFDEFARLKNAQGQVIISPPLEKMPEFRERGKSIIIEFLKSLNENTTYTIYFGDAIVDITEDNPATNYQFVFATGPVIDTLSIRGKVLNAFDHKSEEGVYVMLYNQYEDSVPMKEKPYYLSKTDAAGNFELNNLRKGDFKIFALKDFNSNYLYDLPNEQIAFLDSLLDPKPLKFGLVADSLVRDSLTKDSLSPDKDKFTGNYMLLLFEEIDSTQRIVQNSLLRTGLVELIFKFPPRKLELIPLDANIGHDWCLLEYSTNHDSLNIWNYNIERDTVTLVVKDDTAVLDTLHLQFIVKSRGKKGAVAFSKNEKLLLISKVYGKFDLNRSVMINCSNPVKEFDFSNILMIEGPDTLKPKHIAFVDEIKRNIKITHAWKEHTIYQFIIPDSCIHDIYGLSNDSLVISFTTRELKDYGTLKANIVFENMGEQYLIQLMNAEEKILQQKVITEDGGIVFDYLTPGKYKLKAIHDQNRNNQWDRGLYLEHQQPEPVYYFNTEFQIRANWEIEESWELP